MPISSADRPTSPHLSVYRWQISMVLSILHRMTGVALYFGSALLMSWLASAAYFAETHKLLHYYLSTPVGLLLLAGWTFAFYYHLGNGIRHLFWDIGKGFSLRAVNVTGWLVILFSLSMTGMTWAYAMGCIEAW